MSYTARQLRCLKAMGMVAWTCDTPSSVEIMPVQALPSVSVLPEQAIVDPANSDPDPDPYLVQSAPDSAPDSAPVSSPDSEPLDPISTSPPHAMPELAQWLVEQNLASYSYRGSTVCVHGDEQSALLVVCLASKSQLDNAELPLPLSAEAMRLCDLMLRAIDVQRTHIRMCAINPNELPASQPSQATPVLSSVVTASVRAVLVLDASMMQPSANVEMDTAIVSGTSTPIVRIPHPDCLLQVPALKRCAWENLKSLKGMLDKWKH